MVFYGTPNMLVNEKKRTPFSMVFKSKPLFRFDGEGKYETSDETLIEKLKRKFKFDDDIVAAMPKDGQVKTLRCKKCDYTTTENMGALLKHYKTCHAKER